eukprot:635899-Hanusia_phi.AAC.1
MTAKENPLPDLQLWQTRHPPPVEFQLMQGGSTSPPSHHTEILTRPPDRAGQQKRVSSKRRMRVQHATLISTLEEKLSSPILEQAVSGEKELGTKTSRNMFDSLRCLDPVTSSLFASAVAMLTPLQTFLDPTFPPPPPPPTLAAPPPPPTLAAPPIPTTPSRSS